MADDEKKGPVKPPIIDAKPTAKTDGAKASPAASPQKPVSPKPESKTVGKQTNSGTENLSQRPMEKQGATAKKDPKAPKSGLSFNTLIIASLLGAALGTGGTSFMAFNGIAPFEKGTSSSQFNAAMETLQKRVFDLENAQQIDVSAFAKNDALADATSQINSITKTIATLQLALNDIDKSQNSSRTSSVDAATFAQIQSEVDGLKSSILELSPDNAKALEAQVEQNQKLASAIAKILTLDEAQAGNQSAINTLNQQLSELSLSVSALAEQINAEPAPVELPASANLPLLLDAWEKALNAGNEYVDYATSAAAILPELAQSDALLDDARTGVATTQTLNANFAALIPTFVASNADVPNDAPWFDKLVAQAKSAIGLRPLDQTGNDPLAIVAQIEAALANNDLLGAHLAFKRLPQDWQDLSADFSNKLAAKNNAIKQLDQARQMALDLATRNQGET